MTQRPLSQADPHAEQPVLRAGVELERANAAMIMVHGRGATADGILELASELDQPGFAYLAPQAAYNTWYLNRFLAPLHTNEPFLSSALAKLGNVLAMVTAAGIPTERTILLGFSQGACLAAEFVARNTQQYGGVAVLSGGLIGPDGTPRDNAGSLAGTPVLLGCSDVDAHIPVERVHHSADVLRRLGAVVTERIYPQMGHTINEDELQFVRSMMETAAGQG